MLLVVEPSFPPGKAWLLIASFAMQKEGVPENSPNFSLNLSVKGGYRLTSSNLLS